ncbi:MAG: carboxymuconolactone decarboxylase family protein [Methyloceanibacter sp.]
MEKIDALSDWRSSLLFDREERLPPEYADAMALNRVDDDLRERIKKHWNDDAIVELTGPIASQNLSSKFKAALDAPAQGFCRVPH